MKYIALVLLLVLSLSVATKAEASICRNINGQQLCILNINRSAKNYWEYRAAVSVDGVRRPIEVYNCRDRIKIQRDGTALPFGRDGSGELICSVFNKAPR